MLFSKALGAQRALFIQVKMLCFMLSDDHMIARLTVAARFTAGLDSLVLCVGVCQ